MQKQEAARMLFKMLAPKAKARNTNDCGRDSGDDSGSGDDSRRGGREDTGSVHVG